jgi:hypothetical protein
MVLAQLYQRISDEAQTGSFSSDHTQSLEISSNLQVHPLTLLHLQESRCHHQRPLKRLQASRAVYCHAHPPHLHLQYVSVDAKSDPIVIC